jgi:hypothetical protein
MICAARDHAPNTFKMQWVTMSKITDKLKEKVKDVKDKLVETKDKVTDTTKDTRKELD